ncbi:MAG: 3-oxoacyl-[acyl-carrier-protein] synthase III [Arenicella sp.]|jgi:3-oxoacyl-[acyl-carrier-protein] synthase III
MNYHSNLGLSNNSVIKGLGTKILGSGTYLPKHIVTSEDIFNSFSSESKYGIPSDWMIEKMGIIERRTSNKLDTHNCVVYKSEC